MQCTKLKSFLSVSSNWEVMICQAARLPYVPSLEELEKFCSCLQHRQCRIYHSFLSEEASLLQKEQPRCHDDDARHGKKEPRGFFHEKLIVY